MRMTKYNLWANTKIIEFISKAEPAVLDKELISSFKTIRATLYHIWDAELIWCTRLSGTSFSYWPSEEFKGTGEDAFRQIKEQSAALAAYAESCTEETLQSNIHYSSMDGKKFDSRICDVLSHVVNHSTFHRGQIVTMLRNVGCTELSSTDYITYCRQNP